LLIVVRKSVLVIFLDAAGPRQPPAATGRAGMLANHFEGVPGMTTAEDHAGRLRLRELRLAAGWTQQQLADKLVYLAWTRGDRHAGVNADMVAKWERGVKGISPRYRILLCHLFGVTPEQLGLAPSARLAHQPQPACDRESLLSMVDDAAALLGQLGPAGTVVASGMLSAWHKAAVGRRTMLGMLDPAATDPAGHARMMTATVADFEQLAGRYDELYETADPAALSHIVTAHVHAAGQALCRENTAADRRGLLRNLARVATLAGRLAADDLGDPMSARGYYAEAVDCAREAGDDEAAGTAFGHAAQLARAGGQPAAALAHLAAASVHAERAPGLRPWLAGIEAAVHADRGEGSAARAALARADVPAPAGHRTAPGQPDHRRAHQVAVLGHAYLHAGDQARSRKHLTAALDHLPATARRARVLLLLDLATLELRSGDLPAACRHATTAAGLLDRVPYATGTIRLRAFREATTGQAGPKILRVIDEHLAHAAA